MLRLYDDDRTFDTMFIVLSNRPKGKQMTDQKIQTAPAAGTTEEKGHRGLSASQLAAAVEAAYILEAVRK
jgi:hypothetical protein